MLLKWDAYQKCNYTTGVLFCNIACCASAGNGATSNPRTKVLISPMVLSLIIASYIVTKASISQGKRLSIF